MNNTKLLLTVLVCGLIGTTPIRGTETDVCDLEQIYNSEYTYSLPRAILESFLSGKAFDHKEKYSAEELENLYEDIRDIYKTNLSHNPNLDRVAIVSAGGPGAGKTINMKQHRLRSAQKGLRYGYIDPDDVCLKEQTRTFLNDVRTKPPTLETRVDAYTKWRPASNGANHLVLAHLIRQGTGFYFGTTATSPMTYKFFEFLKKNGYTIQLLHVTAPDEVRWKSIVERDKTFVQTTEEDTREKGLMLPQRIKDTYLAYCDTIEFYYRDGVTKDAVLAARWISEPRELEIIDPDAYLKIKKWHNGVVTHLGKEELKWELTVESSQCGRHSH